jgi:hypothetical protein
MQRKHTETHPDPPITLSHTGETAISKTQRRHKPWFRPIFFLKPQQQPTQTYNMQSQTRLQLRQTHPEK